MRARGARGTLAGVAHMVLAPAGAPLQAAQAALAEASPVQAIEKFAELTARAGVQGQVVNEVAAYAACVAGPPVAPEG